MLHSQRHRAANAKSQKQVDDTNHPQHKEEKKETLAANTSPCMEKVERA
jgi:hypothetical protein